MTQTAKIVDVTKSWIPGDPNVPPIASEGEAPTDPNRDKDIPIRLIEGCNFLPTHYGYRSYFGTNATFPPLLPASQTRVQYILLYQTSQYTSYFVALTETGIFLKDTTEEATAFWHHIVAFDIGDGTEDTYSPNFYAEWTYCLIENVLYMYCQGHSVVYTIDGTIATTEEEEDYLIGPPSDYQLVELTEYGAQSNPGGQLYLGYVDEEGNIGELEFIAIELEFPFGFTATVTGGVPLDTIIGIRPFLLIGEGEGQILYYYADLAITGETNISNAIQPTIYEGDIPDILTGPGTILAGGRPAATLPVISSFVPSFLNMAGQMGIFRAGTRLGFWDSANSTSWSSNVDLEDFTPALETLAGNSIFGAVNGRIVHCRGHGDGFIIYATRSVIGLAFAESGPMLWSDTRIFDGTGITTSRAVTAGRTDKESIFFGTSGIYAIGDYNALTRKYEGGILWPDVYDFLRESRELVAITKIQDRFLFISTVDSDAINGRVLFNELLVDPLTVNIPLAEGYWDGRLELLPRILDGNTVYSVMNTIILRNYGVETTYQRIPGGTIDLGYLESIANGDSFDAYFHIMGNVASPNLLPPNFRRDNQIDIISGDSLILEGDYNPARRLARRNRNFTRWGVIYICTIQGLRLDWPTNFRLGFLPLILTPAQLSALPELAGPGFDDPTAITPLMIQEHAPSAVGFTVNNAVTMNPAFGQVSGSTSIGLDQLVFYQKQEWAQFSGAQQSAINDLMPYTITPFDNTLEYENAESLGTMITGNGREVFEYNSSGQIFHTKYYTERVNISISTEREEVESETYNSIGTMYLDLLVVYLSLITPTLNACVVTGLEVSGEIVTGTPEFINSVPWQDKNDLLDDVVAAMQVGSVTIGWMNAGDTDSFTGGIWIGQVALEDPAFYHTVIGRTYYQAIEDYGPWHASGMLTPVPFATDENGGTDPIPPGQCVYSITKEYGEYGYSQLTARFAGWELRRYERRYDENEQNPVLTAKKKIGSIPVDPDPLVPIEVLYEEPPDIPEDFFPEIIGIRDHLGIISWGPSTFNFEDGTWSENELTVYGNPIIIPRIEIPGMVLAGDYHPPVTASITYPGYSDFFLQTGSLESSYPTYKGSLVYDLHLKKWGKYNGDHITLVDLTPINATRTGIVVHTDKGINAGAFLTTGAVAVFDSIPQQSWVKYGRIGYQKLRNTNLLEVTCNFKDVSSVAIAVESSLDGRSIYYGMPVYQIFSGIITATALPDVDGRFHCVRISGNYDLTDLSVRYKLTGRR